MTEWHRWKKIYNCVWCVISFDFKKVWLYFVSRPILLRHLPTYTSCATFNSLHSCMHNVQHQMGYETWYCHQRISQQNVWVAKWVKKNQTLRREVLAIIMIDPAFYNTLSRINYRLPKVTYIVAVGIYSGERVVKLGSNHDIAQFCTTLYRLNTK